MNEKSNRLFGNYFNENNYPDVSSFFSKKIFFTGSAWAIKEKIDELFDVESFDNECKKLLMKHYKKMKNRIVDANAIMCMMKTECEYKPLVEKINKVN